MKKQTGLLLGVTCGSHLSVHALMLVLPSIMLVLQNEFQVGLATLGLLAAASSFMFGLGAIPTGLLEKRLGGRLLLLIYQTGSVLAVLVILFSHSLGMLAVGLILLGLFSSIYHPAGLTLISRRLRNLSRSLGYHGIAGSLGLALGPILAATFTELISWRAAFGVIAALNIILALITAWWIPPRKISHQVEEDIQNTPHTNRTALLLYYSITVIVGFAFAGFTTYMPTHFSLNTSGVFVSLSATMRGGLFSTLVLLGGIPGQMLGGYAGDRYSRTLILILILVLNIPLLILMGYTSDWTLVSLAVSLGLVHFAVQPIGNSLIAQYTHSTARGLGYGISFFLSFGVGSLAAAAGGLIAEKAGVSLVFPLMGVILLPAVALALRMHKQTR